MKTEFPNIFAKGRHPTDSLPEDVRQDYIKAAADAIAVQDASNIGGVSHSFRQAIQTLQQVSHHIGGLGTDWINQHPIVCLYISKLISLSRFNNDTEEFHIAYTACEKIAQNKPVYFQPRCADNPETFQLEGDQLPSFSVWMSLAALREAFPGQPVRVYAGEEIEGPSYMDVRPKL